MNKHILLFALIISLLFTTSCSSLIYFTQQMRYNIADNNLNLEKVQFYNSNIITLKRALSKEETKIAKGTIILENGQYFEEILIPKKTKGVVVDQGCEFLKIAFENGENRNLRFSLNKNKQYQISANHWKNNYGTIFYDTASYLITPGSSSTLLMVNKKYILNYENTRRIIKGKSVNN